jgi:hypothetical protein
VKLTAHETGEVRLEQVRRYLRDYPESVVAVSYVGEPPPLVALGVLVSLEELVHGTIADPVLARFTQRLQKARPDLTPEELLRLPVPASAGDQEVYTARLGKWLFEKKTLERAQSGAR